MASFFALSTYHSILVQSCVLFCDVTGKGNNCGMEISSSLLVEGFFKGKESQNNSFYDLSTLLKTFRYMGDNFPSANVLIFAHLSSKHA